MSSRKFNILFVSLIVLLILTQAITGILFWLSEEIFPVGGRVEHISYLKLFLPSIFLMIVLIVRGLRGRHP